MVGYVETLTDPSYYGQIILQTFPLIGNYGIMEEDFEGTPRLFGYVVKEWCPTPSNFRCQYTVDDFLKKHHIPGLWGVDTRELTTRIREYGVVNAMISDTIPRMERHRRLHGSRRRGQLHLCRPGGRIPPWARRSTMWCFWTTAPSGISAGPSRAGLPGDGGARLHQRRGHSALNPDGIMLSNGPGDPAENVGPIAELRKLLGKKPIFGICLGHQLLALAAGGKTVKLKYGHRGGNQPCRQVGSRHTFITSQNHGYAVVADSVPGGVEQFVNANDGTCEGMDYPALNAFTVQFHPEACSGPKDTGFLFQRFII